MANYSQAIDDLKAAAEIQLPFQALDYLGKVKRHLEAGDFERQGYFCFDRDSTSEKIHFYRQCQPNMVIMRFGNERC